MVKWNLTSVGIALYDNIIRGNENGYSAKLSWMTPSKFYKFQKQLFDMRPNKNGDELMNYLDEGIIETLMQQMSDPLSIFISFYLSRDEQGILEPYEQEGRHRIIVAKKLGLKHVPVWEFQKLKSENNNYQQEKYIL